MQVELKSRVCSVESCLDSNCGVYSAKCGAYSGVKHSVKCILCEPHLPILTMRWSDLRIFYKTEISLQFRPSTDPLFLFTTASKTYKNTLLTARASSFSLAHVHTHNFCIHFMVIWGMVYDCFPLCKHPCDASWIVTDRGARWWCTMEVPGRCTPAPGVAGPLWLRRFLLINLPMLCWSMKEASGWAWSPCRRTYIWTGGWWPKDWRIRVFKARPMWVHKT